MIKRSKSWHTFSLGRSTWVVVALCSCCLGFITGRGCFLFGWGHASPQWGYSCCRALVRRWCLVRDLVFFVFLGNEFGPVLGGSFLFEFHSPGPRAQHASVVKSCTARVLILDTSSFHLIVLQEIEKAFVAAHLNDSDLEGVPALWENLFDIALVSCESPLVHHSAVWAKECAEGDVAVGGPVSLAVDTESIVAVILDLRLEEGACLRRLWITRHRRRTWGHHCRKSRRLHHCGVCCWRTRFSHF